MVQRGDVIENPVTGERITFVCTSADSGGATAELDLELREDASLAAEHVHQRQEERFEVLDGRIGCGAPARSPSEARARSWSCRPARHMLGLRTRARAIASGSPSCPVLA